MSVDEVAALWRVSRRTVTRALEAGDILGQKVGGTWVVDANAAEKRAAELRADRIAELRELTGQAS